MFTLNRCVGDVCGEKYLDHPFLDPGPQTMLEDKKRSTDWEATYDAIEEAVARESYLTWLRENEKRSLPLEKHAGSQVCRL